jgi:hypothetical protein
MKNNEILEKVLAGEIDSKYIKIYELSHGRVNSDVVKDKLTAYIKNVMGHDEIRYICHNCVVTQDVHPNRLNIQLDEKNYITEIYTG